MRQVLFYWFLVISFMLNAPHLTADQEEFFIPKGTQLSEEARSAIDRLGQDIGDGTLSDYSVSVSESNDGYRVVFSDEELAEGLELASWSQFVDALTTAVYVDAQDPNAAVARRGLELGRFLSVNSLGVDSAKIDRLLEISSLRAMGLLERHFRDYPEFKKWAIKNRLGEAALESDVQYVWVDRGGGVPGVRAPNGSWTWLQIKNEFEVEADGSMPKYTLADDGFKVADDAYALDIVGGYEDTPTTINLEFSSLGSSAEGVYANKMLKDDLIPELEQLDSSKEASSEKAESVDGEEDVNKDEGVDEERVTDDFAQNLGGVVCPYPDPTYLQTSLIELMQVQPSGSVEDFAANEQMLDDGSQWVKDVFGSFLVWARENGLELGGQLGAFSVEELEGGHYSVNRMGGAAPKELLQRFADHIVLVEQSHCRADGYHEVYSMLDAALGVRDSILGAKQLASLQRQQAEQADQEAAITTWMCDILSQWKEQLAEIDDAYDHASEIKQFRHGGNRIDWDGDAYSDSIRRLEEQRVAYQKYIMQLIESSQNALSKYNGERVKYLGNDSVEAALDIRLWDSGKSNKLLPSIRIGRLLTAFNTIFPEDLQCDTDARQVIVDRLVEAQGMAEYLEVNGIKLAALRIRTLTDPHSANAVISGLNAAAKTVEKEDSLSDKKRLEAQWPVYFNQIHVPVLQYLSEFIDPTLGGKYTFEIVTGQNGTSKAQVYRLTTPYSKEMLSDFKKLTLYLHPDKTNYPTKESQADADDVYLNFSNAQASLTKILRIK